MNYNFKLLFERECMPLMRTDRIKKAIEKGINAYRKNQRIDYICERLTEQEEQLNNREYKLLVKQKEALFKNELMVFKNYEKNKYPLSYAVGDSICGIDEEIEERIVPYLIERGILQTDKNRPTDFMVRDEEGELCECYDEVMDDYMETENYKKYEEYKNKIIEPYLNAERDKDYRFYCVWGACHWWNTTFGLELARLVMPSVKWKIIQNDFHTTITSEDEKLVFDILYFDEKDTETYGGKDAINEAKRVKRVLKTTFKGQPLFEED